MATGQDVVPGRWARRPERGLTTIMAAILIVVVLALVGVGTFAALGGFSKSPGTSCAPITAPACGRFANFHDVTLLVPFKSIQQGAKVPFTANVPAGETATSYTFYFGDGQKQTSSAPTVSHNYSGPGTYLVAVTATVSGLVHDNYFQLLKVDVTPSFSANVAGEVPGIAGAIVSNSTTPAGSRTVTAVLQPGGTVTLSGSYTAAPTNPAFLPLPPKIVGTGGTVSPTSATNTSVTATGTFATPGTYLVTFVGSATNGNQTVFQNFTWTIFVATAGLHAGVQGNTAVRTLHPGTIISYELAPGGAFSEDPAIDYETVGYEPIVNVYQTLITYNGSQTGPGYENFVPELATCVPGSPQCVTLYKDSLADGWNFTFVLNPSAQFYDPLTQVHWPVYPTDVLFSMARTMGFSTLPCVTCNNGWILTQALLNSGNATWDAIHGSYNNTPSNIFNSITVNESGGVCPAAAMTPGQGNGCVTFHAYGDHHVWPYFLELIADGLGGSVVPCGWYSAPSQAAGIPYWTKGNVSGAGDQPCNMPGQGMGIDPTLIPTNGWDGWEQLGSGFFGTYLGHVQFNMVGSGPYYLSQYAIATSYTLKANPGYAQNPFCTWAACQPAAGKYASTVEVTWETTATPGEYAYSSGVADFASIPSPDFGFLLQLISAGKVNAINAPTLTIGFYPFNMNFNVQGATKFSTSPVSIKNDFFSYLGMRQFFARAYPYQTVQNTINTRDGIQLGFQYGGAIPQYMANYYPRDITWPNTDPCSDASSANCPIYWWNQMQDSSGQYYDPEVSACSPSNPCQMPLFGSTGSPAGDQVRALWAAQVQRITGGALRVSPIDINFVDIVINAEFSGPSLNPMPVYGLGWAPDYPDPTDYVVPLYQANGTYTYGDAVMQSLYVQPFTTGCGGHNGTDYSYWANTTIPQSCQGYAYKAMLTALAVAAKTPAGPYRLSLYDLAERIASQLALYTYTSQGNEVATAAAWVDPGSLNTNVTLGGGGDETFFWVTGNGVQFSGSS